MACHAANVETPTWTGDFSTGSDRSVKIYDDLTFEDFWRDHLQHIEPLILSSKATSSWPARQSWAHPSRPLKPNLAALGRYAHHVVPVADTHKREYTEFERTELPLRDVLAIWERAEASQTESKGGDNDGRGLYVKDYHMMAEIEAEGRGVGEVYEVPECFRDDWLNPHYTPTPRQPVTGAMSPSSPSPCTSDFRFTYLGPRGTFTPFHRDVYASYSWSANIVGRKAWWLFHPESMPAVRDLWQQSLARRRAAGEDVRDAGELPFDLRQEPDIAAVAMKLIQEEGEVIFVPSGWYHQVVNLDFCISINHNHLNAATLSRVYDALADAQDKVEQSLSDVKEMIIERLGSITADADAAADATSIPAWEEEWTEEVQKVLEMDAGWAWKQFWECVERNLKDPPLQLPPQILQANRQTVELVIDRYKTRREWQTLPPVRETVLRIQQGLSVAASSPHVDHDSHDACAM